MSEKIRRDALAILFLTIGVFLTVALVSFHQVDPSLSSWNSGGGEVRNWGGWVGAILSDLLLQLFGIGAIGFPLLCLALAYWTFRGEGITGRWGRAAGGLLAVVSLLGILSFFTGHIRIIDQDIFLPGIVGYLLGVNFIGWLLNPVGGLLCLTALLLFSLMLLTGLPLSGLPSLWRKKKSPEQVRAMVKEKLSSRKDEWDDKTPREPPKDAPPRIVAPAPAAESAQAPRAAGKEFVLPSLDLLEPPPVSGNGADEEALQRNARALIEKLAQYGIDGAITEIRTGPLVTTYEFKPAPGIKANRVVAMGDDLALAMRCESVRVVPNIPGKGVMGFEIPNDERFPIVLREILGSKAYAESESPLSLALGKDIFGEPVVRDLSKMPHLLIAGATGSGKSIALHSMILSILFRATPEEVRLILVDPKMLELTPYEGIPHLYRSVVTQPKDAGHVLKWAVGEMTGRYKSMVENGVRHIDAYNQLVEKRSRSAFRVKGRNGEEEELARLPQIVIVIDELADLMMTTTSRRDVEDSITRLTQMARAAGIHLIFATQRPSVDVITGIIKANFPARISFKVASQYDSRTILEQSGGETLLGFGDMLFLQPGVGGILRIHGPYVGEGEIQRVVDHLKGQGAPVYEPSITALAAEEEEPDPSRDPKFDDAVEVVVQAGRASVSLLQRRLQIGFNRAARIVEEMERQGIVGPSEGGKPREVYVARKE
ncbi:MAG: DNA translocase FtsK 4TM domain-containing protein [Deltaproteobacteria bacterium]|nr:DNA translocase FtsK 4TM domain-containing protein [Deltaproteobacteria bacterium]